MWSDWESDGYDPCVLSIDGLGWFRVGRPRPDPSRAQHYIVSVYSNGNIDRESWDGLYEFDVEVIHNKLHA